MNITKEVIDRPQEKEKNESTKSEILRNLGILSCKRTIDIFIKEANNINNIVGHNLAIRTQCIITNYSISKLENNKVYNKTVYTCDIDFPNYINAETIKTNLIPILKSATITPIYAFSISHLEKPNGEYENFGLTMIDIHDSLSNTFGIVNFSNYTAENPIFKELIYGNCYNPKYYTNIEAKELHRISESRSGNINDFIDKNTTIYCNPIDKEIIDTYVNDEKQTQLYIDNKTIETPHLLLNLFSKLLFTSLDCLEFIYNSSDNSSPLMIKRVGYFTKFNSNFENECLDEIYDIINKCMDEYKNKIKEKFYLMYTLNEHMSYAEVIFNNGKRINIKVPIEKLYCEYSLDNEMMMNCIEYDKENNKEYYLEYTMKDKENGASIPGLAAINNMTTMIENYAHSKEINLIEMDTQRLKLLEK